LVHCSFERLGLQEVCRALAGVFPEGLSSRLVRLKVLKQEFFSS